MVFRLRLPVEIEQPGTDLSSTTQACVLLVYQGGRWRAQCEDPPAASPLCESLEQALIAVAKEAVAELQSGPRSRQIAGDRD